jgi:hypothetical protein
MFNCYQLPAIAEWVIFKSGLHSSGKVGIRQHMACYKAMCLAVIAFDQCSSETLHHILGAIWKWVSFLQVDFGLHQCLLCLGSRWLHPSGDVVPSPG